MNKQIDIAQIVIDLILDLNETANSGNKSLRSIRIWHKIKSAKDSIISTIKKEEYNAYDIFNFLQFIKICRSLNICKKLPDNIIECSYHKHENIMEVSSGSFGVLIHYGNKQHLKTVFKPIIELDQSKINIEWELVNSESHIIDFKEVSSFTQKYNTSVDTLVKTSVNPAGEHLSMTKILTFSSAEILYNAFLICIESIFNDIDMRYKKNGKK